MSAGLQYFPLILFSILLNTAAQICIKMGTTAIGHFDFKAENIVPIFLKLAQTPYILGGVLLYVFSLGTWILTLSRVDLSFAYPLTSLGYIFTGIFGYYILQEDLNLTRILGILVIISGVYLVTRSA